MVLLMGLLGQTWSNRLFFYITLYNGNTLGTPTPTTLTTKTYWKRGAWHPQYFLVIRKLGEVIPRRLGDLQYEPEYIIM